MVRREEQPWESRATIVLDTRRQRPPRRGPDGQLRVGRVGRGQHRRCTCAQAGYKLRLVTGAGVDLDATERDGEGALLDRLAEVSRLGRAATSPPWSSGSAAAPTAA